ncbi:hypothetical protein SC09_contig10orf00054 [Bacillus subtilis]|uniref:Uncharacterized protein n=1 Tax=Bacillus subtilis TaxID=1423 RepID=A0A0D1L2T0_BACIU|nr:hypothetical protein SC09_contig10orf00054 [Bacillus subtilis]
MPSIHADGCGWPWISLGTNKAPGLQLSGAFFPAAVHTAGRRLALAIDPRGRLRVLVDLPGHKKSAWLQLPAHTLPAAATHTAGRRLALASIHADGCGLRLPS